MYATVQDIRDEGVPTPPDDARVTQSLELATQYIDLVTGRWFDDVAKTLIEDSKDSKAIFLDIPIISVSEIKVDDTMIAPENYKLYNRGPQDLDNPKIIFYPDVKTSRLNRGYQNVEITGHFGYLIDGTTPALIKKICIKLAIGNLPFLYGDESEQKQFNMRLIEERTDGHSYKLSDLLESGSLTGDVEIDNVLKLYFRPIRIGVA